MQQGKLNNPSGPQAYRREVEHAGYTRDIINKNPVRFDEDGDEIEDDDMSENGEINDDDPYSGIVIEGAFRSYAVLRTTFLINSFESQISLVR